MNKSFYVALCGWVGLIVGAQGACARGTEQDDTDTAPAATTSTGGMGGMGGMAGMGGDGGDGGDGGQPPQCEEEPCKLVAPQCGCPEGERCLTVGAQITCEPAGELGDGEACANNCGAGLRCINTLTGGDSLCHKYCKTDDDCSSGPGSKCVLAVPQHDDVFLCTHNCDPVSNAGCLVAEMKCDFAQIVQQNTGFFTWCSGAGDATHGESCTSSNQCEAGHGCINAGGPTMQCLRWCNQQNPICPDAGQCLQLDPPITIGSITYGACQPPP